MKIQSVLNMLKHGENTAADPQKSLDLLAAAMYLMEHKGALGFIRRIQLPAVAH